MYRHICERTHVTRVFRVFPSNKQFYIVNRGVVWIALFFFKFLFFERIKPKERTKAYLDYIAATSTLRHHFSNATECFGLNWIEYIQESNLMIHSVASTSIEFIP